VLGCSILLERLSRLRERAIIPADFTAKFLDRLHGGKLDAGRALDYCEENPSPAARVALAAVRRWGRPAADLERAVALAHRVESDRLRRNVGTFRRLAVLAPLIGFLGTLLAAGRILAAIPPGVPLAEGLDLGFHWGPELASALGPLTSGVIIATLAVVAYDGLQARIERLSGALDRLGAETIDAIAMTVPISSAPLSVPTSRKGDPVADSRGSSHRMHPPSETTPAGIFGLVHSPHTSGTSTFRPTDRRAQRFPRPKSEGETSSHV
jgi:biopolymer transport protein ExbB